MAKVTIIASITAKDDQIELVKTELMKLLDISRGETGCINYDLHQNNDDPAHFLFYENWENRELWQKHIGNKHVLAFIAATEDAIGEFTFNEMTELA